jgi:hypothetical protein
MSLTPKSMDIIMFSSSIYEQYQVRNLGNLLHERFVEIYAVREIQYMF